MQLLEDTTCMLTKDGMELIFEALLKNDMRGCVDNGKSEDHALLT